MFCSPTWFLIHLWRLEVWITQNDNLWQVAKQKGSLAATAAGISWLENRRVKRDPKLRGTQVWPKKWSLPDISPEPPLLFQERNPSNLTRRRSRKRHWRDESAWFWDSKGLKWNPKDEKSAQFLKIVSIKIVAQCGANSYICSTQDLPCILELIFHKLQLCLIHKSFTSEIKPEPPQHCAIFECIRQSFSKG